MQRLRTGALALILIPLQAVTILAESDNFDSYTSREELLKNGWVQALFQAGAATTTFPSIKGNQAMRVQTLPTTTTQAACLWYRPTTYTDFVVEVDLADWPGTDKNQMLGLVGGLTFTSPETSNNIGEASGYLFNYNAAQDGENPGNRRRGRLELTKISSGLNWQTLTVTDVTLQQGRSYRLVLHGRGSELKGSIYDLEDLTQPLATLQYDFVLSTLNKGACGILVRSRQDANGTIDGSFDNYYSAATDPNLAVAPGLSHPVTGTPAVDTRMPARRFTNFHDPKLGISFTAKSYSPAIVNAPAAKLWLNGTDFSTQLKVSANGASISGHLPGSVLEANKVYRAEIQVTDTSGVKSSSNTFWFDTYSEAYLGSAGVRVVEAEDYNYQRGKYQPEPIAVSGFLPNPFGPNSVNGEGVGYLGVEGVEGVDFHDNSTNAWNFIASFGFRGNEPVATSNGMPDPNDPGGFSRYDDPPRTRYTTNELIENLVFETEPGEWLNYTRNFGAGSYRAYLRVGSVGATVVGLHQITSDPALPAQTTTKLGSFNIPNLLTFNNYIYLPLVDESGSQTTLALSGVHTLRLQMAGVRGNDNNNIALNYILFVPAPAEASTKLFASATVGGPYSEDASAVVDAPGRAITTALSEATRFYQIQAGTALRIKAVTRAGGKLRIDY